MEDRYMDNKLDENRSVFGYIAQLLAMYGAMVIIFMIFTKCIGTSTRDYSTLFELGSEGLTLNTLLQLLGLAVLITMARVLLLTDNVIKNLKMVTRNVLFILSIFIMVIAFSIVFRWFPIDDVRAWIGFIVSFTLSMTASLLITRYIEKSENRRMQEALEKYMEKRSGE